MKEITTTIRLPEDLHEFVQKLAKENDRSYAAQLRTIIRNEQASREAGASVNA